MKKSVRKNEMLISHNRPAFGEAPPAFSDVPRSPMITMFYVPKFTGRGIPSVVSFDQMSSIGSPTILVNCKI